MNIEEYKKLFEEIQRNKDYTRANEYREATRELYAQGYTIEHGWGWYLH
jgi:hypothetical protein